MKNFFLNRIFIALFMLTVGLAEGWWLGNRQGFVQGVDFLFNQCYNVGGVVLDERNGKAYAMLCGPLGEFPKEELPPLDKKEDMWYNRNINNI